jgi:HTH-type transcriptional regulator/antitoxin HigA
MPIVSFQTDYAIQPGEILCEYLETSGMSQRVLAKTTGIPRLTLRTLLEGEVQLTEEVAAKLGVALGRPAHFWRSLDTTYLDSRSSEGS